MQLAPPPIQDMEAPGPPQGIHGPPVGILALLLVGPEPSPGHLPAAVGQELVADVVPDGLVDGNDRREAAGHLERLLTTVPRSADVDEAGGCGRFCTGADGSGHGSPRGDDDPVPDPSRPPQRSGGSGAEPAAGRA